MFPKDKTTMKEEFCDDIPAVQAAVTQKLKNILLNNMTESMYKLVDHSERCFDIFMDKITFKRITIRVLFYILKGLLFMLSLKPSREMFILK